VSAQLEHLSCHQDTEWAVVICDIVFVYVNCLTSCRQDKSLFMSIVCGIHPTDDKNSVAGWLAVCRAAGLKLNTENVRTRGVGLLVQLLLRTSVARVRVLKMCCTLMCLYWQENGVSDFNLWGTPAF